MAARSVATAAPPSEEFLYEQACSCHRAPLSVVDIVPTSSFSPPCSSHFGQDTHQTGERGGEGEGIGRKEGGAGAGRRGRGERQDCETHLMPGNRVPMSPLQDSMGPNCWSQPNGSSSRALHFHVMDGIHIIIDSMQMMPPLLAQQRQHLGLLEWRTGTQPGK